MTVFELINRDIGVLVVRSTVAISSILPLVKVF